MDPTATPALVKPTAVRIVGVPMYAPIVLSTPAITTGNTETYNARKVSNFVFHPKWCSSYINLVLCK